VVDYETFALVYDQVMDSALYEKWLDFTKKTIPAGQHRLLDLACGTGNLPVKLAKEGFEVTGLDLSEEMLAIAFNLALKENVSVNFVNRNMLDLSGLTGFEVVTCFSDSLCYLKNAQEVQQVFNEVSHALVAGGIFIFDVHSLFQMDEIFPGYSYHENSENFAFLWDSFATEIPHAIVHELTFFIRDQESGEFSRIDETHQERTYPLDDYLIMLKNAGFTKSRVSADFNIEKPTAESKRWFFVGYKGE